MTATAETGAMFGTDEHVRQVAAEYGTRLDLVLGRIREYHADCQRRYATDEYHDTARCIRQSAEWLAGDFDRTWAGQFGSLANFRAHYADDALRGALHHLVWAEHYAGLVSRDQAFTLDPWR